MKGNSWKQWVRPAVMPCGKVGYLTRRAARNAARDQGRNPAAVRLHVYRCDGEGCAAMPWHLTKRCNRHATAKAAR